MSRIISAGRRTDIPAFFSEWLVRRLEAGSCDTWHPFARRWSTVSLRPEDVGGIVLWTKNIGPLLPALCVIRRRYVFYVQFTITGHSRLIEPGVISSEDAVAQARRLSREFGSEAVVWRFDPIVHTQHGGAEDTVARFDALSASLEGVTRACTISFMSPYRRQRRAFERAGLEQDEPSSALRLELSQRIAAIARDRGMTVAACCNDDIVGGEVIKARCVDPDRLRRLGADLPSRVPNAPSRKQCGCAQSTDISAYDLCGGGCAYCYANQDHDLADRNRARHDPAHLGLAEAFLSGADS